jgi:transcriptional regulator GlxA family with amidase domain
MLDNLAKPVSVDDLAERAHMSRRTLIRRFRKETSTPPMTWLADARIDRARELLEATTVPIEQIGRRPDSALQPPCGPHFIGTSALPLRHT